MANHKIIAISPTLEILDTHLAVKRRTDRISNLHFETRFLGQAINPADIIDFENSIPHQDQYVFRNVKINGRKSNIYTSSNSQMVYHRVKSGDTLGKIARIYGTTVNELCRLNGLKSTSMLRIGQSIRCSAGVETAAKATPKAQTQKKSTASASPSYGYGSP